eukprot:g48377.t1
MSQHLAQDQATPPQYIISKQRMHTSFPHMVISLDSADCRTRHTSITHSQSGFALENMTIASRRESSTQTQTRKEGGRVNPTGPCPSTGQEVLLPPPLGSGDFAPPPHAQGMMAPPLLAAPLSGPNAPPSLRHPLGSWAPPLAYQFHQLPAAQAHAGPPHPGGAGFAAPGASLPLAPPPPLLAPAVGFAGPGTGHPLAPPQPPLAPAAFPGQAWNAWATLAPTAHAVPPAPAHGPSAAYQSFAPNALPPPLSPRDILSHLPLSHGLGFSGIAATAAMAAQNASISLARWRQFCDSITDASDRAQLRLLPAKLGIALVLRQPADAPLQEFAEFSDVSKPEGTTWPSNPLFGRASSRAFDFDWAFLLDALMGWLECLLIIFGRGKRYLPCPGRHRCISPAFPSVEGGHLSHISSSAIIKKLSSSTKGKRDKEFTTPHTNAKRKREELSDSDSKKADAEAICKAFNKAKGCSKQAPHKPWALPDALFPPYSSLPPPALSSSMSPPTSSVLFQSRCLPLPQLQLLPLAPCVLSADSACPTPASPHNLSSHSTPLLPAPRPPASPSLHFTAPAERQSPFHPASNRFCNFWKWDRSPFRHHTSPVLSRIAAWRSKGPAAREATLRARAKQRLIFRSGLSPHQKACFDSLSRLSRHERLETLAKLDEATIRSKGLHWADEAVPGAPSPAEIAATLSIPSPEEVADRSALEAIALEPRLCSSSSSAETKSRLENADA